MAVGDCSVTEGREWRPPYQTGKTVHVHAKKHYKHDEDGRTAPGVCGNGSVPLSHSGNAVTRIGIHTHTLPQTVHRRCFCCVSSVLTAGFVQWWPLCGFNQLCVGVGLRSSCFCVEKYLTCLMFAAVQFLNVFVLALLCAQFV